MDFKVLSSATYRRMPWKNGGGETFEIAAAPAAATLETLDWRLSMAVVATDGPFSLFEGIDRTLTVLDGDGLELVFGQDGSSRLLTPRSLPFPFPGDVPVHGVLTGGTVTDLNVMTRRGSWHHTVRRVHVAGTASLHSRADALAVFCVEGTFACAVADAARFTLGPRDCALAEGAVPPLELSAPSPATTLVIELYRLATAS